MTCPTNLAEGLAVDLEVLFSDLTVVFHNVDHDVVLVQELGDILGATVPSHDVAVILKRFDKSDSSGWGHGKLLTIWGEFVTPLLVDGLP